MNTENTKITIKYAGYKDRKHVFVIGDLVTFETYQLVSPDFKEFWENKLATYTLQDLWFSLCVCCEGLPLALEYDFKNKGMETLFNYLETELDNNRQKYEHIITHTPFDYVEYDSLKDVIYKRYGNRKIADINQYGTLLSKED